MKIKNINSRQNTGELESVDGKTKAEISQRVRDAAVLFAKSITCDRSGPTVKFTWEDSDAPLMPASVAVAMAVSNKDLPIDRAREAIETARRNKDLPIDRARDAIETARRNAKGGG